MMHRPSNNAEAAGPIHVIWDIKSCPVLNEYYARRVGPCVRWYLRKLGYSRDISITVVGQLTKVPEDILEAVSSTGISLHNSFRGSLDVELLLYTSPRRSNILLLATPRKFSYPTDYIKKKGSNVISPFPNNSNKADVKYLWKTILSDPKGDNKCSEKVEPVSWNCGVCNGVVGQGFENFMTHLSSQEHKRELQLWYPVQGYVHFESYQQAFEDNDEEDGFEDEDQVFEEEGEAVEANVDFPLVNISGGGLNLTITVVGELSKVPEDILEAISSTGISLYNSTYGSRDMVLLLLDCVIGNPCPAANIMVISLPSNFSNLIQYLREKGCNFVLPFPFDSSIADAKYLWENFLLAGELKDDKCNEAGEPASLVCAVCNEFAGQGFENFITHLSTQEHKREGIYKVPSGDGTSYVGLRGLLTGED